MMIQDIAPHSLRNQYCERTEPAGDNPVFCFRGPKLLVLRNAGHSFEKTAGAAFNQKRLSMPEDGEDEKQFYLERGRYLRLPEVRDLGAGREYTYLFTVDGRPVFLLREDLKEEEIPGEYAFVDIRKMRMAAYGPKHRLFSALTAYQLSNWYRDNRFCGTCGHPTVHSDTERALRCPECGRVIYPRIIPAVIVGVLNGDRILLTKYAGRDFAHYALIAGFTEIGETLKTQSGVRSWKRRASGSRTSAITNPSPGVLWMICWPAFSVTWTGIPPSIWTAVNSRKPPGIPGTRSSCSRLTTASPMK